MDAPEPAPGPAPPTSTPGPLLVTAGFLALVAAAGMVALTLARPKASPPHGEGPAGGEVVGAETPGPLPDLGEVPDFSLEERSGATVSRESLKGRIWVADFIFTTCAGICPNMSRNMASVQNVLRKDGDAVCVSITVDPDKDTPERLREYARRYGASDEAWYFLRGPIGEVHSLGFHGFKMLDEKDPFLHSMRFALVDRTGRIRGYYRGTEEEGVKLILEDYRRLRDERTH